MKTKQKANIFSICKQIKKQLIIYQQNEEIQQKLSIIDQMNERDMQFLSNAFPRYYGRISTTKIDIKQMGRFMERSGLKQKNPFLAYAVTEKSDEEKRQDVVDFNELMNRINSTLLNKADSMGIQTMLHTLDADRDGFLGIQDILGMNQQLGTAMQQQKLGEILQKITDQGTKINKNELASILF